MKNVEFVFEEIKYVIKDLKFGKKWMHYERILLPDGRMLFVDKWTKTGPRQPEEVHFSKIVITDMNNDKNSLEFKHDCLIAEYKNATFNKAMQVHHDLYVTQAKKGTLDPKDLGQYELAISREKAGQVKPLQETPPQ